MRVKVGDRFKNIDGERTLGCVVEITGMSNLFYHYKVVKTSEHCKKKLSHTECSKSNFKEQFVPVKSNIRKL